MPDCAGRAGVRVGRLRDPEDGRGLGGRDEPQRAGRDRPRFVAAFYGALARGARVGDEDLALSKLIEVKRAAGRPKDFEAIAELEVLLEELQR